VADLRRYSAFHKRILILNTFVSDDDPWHSACAVQFTEEDGGTPMQQDHPVPLPACAFAGPLPQAPDALTLTSLGLALCFLAAQVWLGIG
jgi:hypothetical protein